MFDSTQLMLFVSASFILAITPGPDIIYTLTRGVAQGRKAALCAAAGFNFGILFHSLFAAFGISAILRTSALAYQGVKYAGAAYLVYVGIQMWRSHSQSLSPEGCKAMKPMAIFRQTVLCNILNPKVALFFLAFLPQFVDPERGNVGMQMFLLGLIFMIVSFPVFASLAFFSGAIGNRLKGNPRVGSWLKRAAGGVLVSLGLALAVPESR